MEATNDPANYWISQIEKEGFRALSSGIGLGELQSPTAVLSVQPAIHISQTETSPKQINRAAVTNRAPKTANVVRNSARNFAIAPIFAKFTSMFSSIFSGIRLPSFANPLRYFSHSNFGQFICAKLVDICVLGFVSLFLVAATGYLTDTFVNGFEWALFGQDPVFKWLGKLKILEKLAAFTTLYLFYWMIFRIVAGKTIGDYVIYGESTAKES